MVITTSIAIDHPENEIKNLRDKNEVPGILYDVHESAYCTIIR